MDKKNIKFDDTEIEKYKLDQHKSPILINNTDNNMVPFGKKDFKYFIGYKSVKQIRPLFIFLLKNSAYIIDFDKINVRLFDKDDKIFKMYNGIWKHFSNSIKKEFNSEPIYN